MINIIIEDLGKIFSENEINKIMNSLHFFKPSKGNEPGIYIWKEEVLFYYSEIDERGRLTEYIEKKNEEDILYEIYSVVTLNKAIEYATLNKAENDFRKIMFDKQLELMKKIDKYVVYIGSLSKVI